MSLITDLFGFPAFNLVKSDPIPGLHDWETHLKV